MTDSCPQDGHLELERKRGAFYGDCQESVGTDGSVEII
jgi:hypothetical protein